jgi:hypothetical protein
MMLANKRKFYGGFGMMVAFIIVLIIFFSPIYSGQNGLDYLDNLYNSISKGSAYYIPDVKEEADKFKGNAVSVTLNMTDNKQAEQTVSLFRASSAEAMAADSQLKVTGDLGKILENALADSDAMYTNDGQTVWKAFKEMEKDLKKQKEFKEADAVALVVKKGLESSYNYYQIEPQKIGDRFGIVIFSLVFYVV